MCKTALTIFILFFASLAYSETCPSINELNTPDMFNHVPTEPAGWFAAYAIERDIPLDRFEWAVWSPDDSESTSDKEQILCSYRNIKHHAWQLLRVEYVKESQLSNHHEWVRKEIGRSYIYRCESQDPTQCSFDQ